MKPISRNGLFLSVMLAILTLLGLTACSGEQDKVEVECSAYQPTSTTIQELKTYNDSLIGAATRREIQSDDKTMIALADAGGALAGAAAGLNIGKYFGQPLWGLIGGAVIGGACASYKIYHSVIHDSGYQIKTIPSKDFDNPSIYAACYALEKDKTQSEDYTKGVACGLDSCAVYVGILHNKVLNRIDKINKDEIESIVHEKLYNWEQEMIHSEEYRIAFKNGSEGITAISTIVDKECAEIMELFSTTLKNIDLNNERLNEITTKYTYVIKNSTTLTEDDKSCLYAFLAVANYSYDYWSEMSKKSPFAKV